MRVSCPCCNALHELDALVAEVEARRALARLAHLGGALEVAAIAYMGCFRPKRRVLSWGRLTRLVDELAGCVESGGVRRKGRRWTVTRAQWAEALHIVIERRNAGALDTPLNNHAYLYEVAAGISSKAEAAAERDIEEARRAGRGPERTGAASAADRYEALLDEAHRLGVARDGNGLVKRMPDLTEAVRQARLQEGLSDDV